MRTRMLWMGFLLSVMNTTLYSQHATDGGLDSLAVHFIRSVQADTREKIFVQTSKSYYIAGEDLWFKAYCLNIVSHKVSSYSRIVYADLVNDRDSVISRLLLNNRSQGRRLEGEISLGTGLAEGYYWLRIYTTNILQEDSNRICVHPVFIFNPGKQDFVPKLKEGGNPAGTGKPEVSFYPEGGSIVSGNDANVAVKVKDKEGNPMSVSGFIAASGGTAIKKFKTDSMGLGQFSFFADISGKYTVHISPANGPEFIYPLPAIDPFASQLSVVDQTGDTVKCLVSLGDSIYNKGRLSYVLAISRGNLCFAAAGTDNYRINIPKSNFSSGKASILLFDDQQRVISERNIYIEAPDLHVSVSADKENYGPREKVNLRFSTDGLSGTPLRSLLSLSVTDYHSGKVIDDHFKDDDIVVSDLPHGKYSPEERDLMMLVQKTEYMGWKNNEGAAPSTGNTKIQDSSFENIYGKVVNKKNEPLKNQMVTIYLKAPALTVKSDSSDEQGRFHFLLPEDLRDSAEIRFELNNSKTSTTDKRIVIDPFPFPVFPTPVWLKKRFPDSVEMALVDFNKSELDTMQVGTGKGWLRAITVRRYKKRPVDYDETRRVSLFSKIISGDQITQSANGTGNSLLSVGGVSIKNGYLVVMGGTLAAEATSEPLLVVDGTEIDLTNPARLGDPMHSPQPQDVSGSSPILNFLNSIPPAEIDFIEVLETAEASVYGVRGGNGVVIVNTRNSLRKSETRGDALFYFKGPYSAPEFSEPDYNNKEIKSSAFPDLRSTIYWNGNLLTDTSGKASVFFYTADSPATYMITYKGITSNGDIITGKMKLERR